jgi:hypothetical protein
MTDEFLAPDPARIDADWMTRALRAAGVIDQARVSEVAARPVGNGLVGDSFRFSLAYDRPSAGAPESVVGKFPAKDPASRKSGSDQMLYRSEVTFYRQIAGTVAIRTPRPLVTAYDPATDDFTLLFEDLGPARQGDQLAGCSVADAHTALAEAAALHAPRWGDASLAQIDVVVAKAERMMPMIMPMLPPIVGMFRERYDGQLEPEFMAVVEAMPGALGRMIGDGGAPFTVQHGDFRLDNILFDVQGGRAPMATLDWQTVTVGPGLTDVAYFLSAGLDPAERRAHEADLIEGYHGELMRRGVKDYPLETCRRDYRRYSMHGVLMGVFSALAVERTERGDALFLKMTRGACQLVLDNDTLSFWRD